MKNDACKSKTQAAIRGPVLTFTGDPFKDSIDETMIYEPDGIVAFANGAITHFGPARVIEKQLPAEIKITNYGPDSLISAGFIDSHVHYPQTPMIGAFGAQLLDWLNKYTFPMERKFADKNFARSVSKIFLQECLKNGITTSCVFGTVFPQSVDALFEEADKHNMRIAGGKVMMDRNAPDYLRDTPETSYAETKALIEKWHGHNRIMYAITPRFAPTSTPEQLAIAGALCSEYPECYMQTHIAENLDEVEWVKTLFPEREGYLDVYDYYGLCRPRALFGHGIHLTEDELKTLHSSGSAITHCPTSNFFLGSGYFNVSGAKQQNRPVRVGLGTDIGAGTSFSMLTTLGEAYKAAQLNNYALYPGQAWYLATRGTAHAMYIDDKVGSIAPGMEADIIVIDMKSTPIIDYRMQFVQDIQDALFVQMTLGDDRAIRATYIAGELRYRRGDDVSGV